MDLLRKELRRQVLPDGGHEERSTAYHRMVRHDLSEIAELADRRAAGRGARSAGLAGAHGGDGSRPCEGPTGDYRS